MVPEVLADAARDGVALLLWRHESFIFTDSYDEAAWRYRGLRCGQRVDLIHHQADGLLIKSDVAARQHDADAAAAAASRGAPAEPATAAPAGEDSNGTTGVESPGAWSRFYATDSLTMER